jgi:hypothetical protein
MPAYIKDHEMKKVIIIMVLALVSSNAMAEWLEIGSSGSGADLATFYVEDSRIKVNGNKRMVWLLSDISSGDLSSTGVRFYSTKSKEEYDCYNETSIFLYFAGYSGRMGRGNVVESYNYENSVAEAIIPNSVHDIILSYACKIK